MGFLDKYPYTNWHNVNLDWVLERVKEWGQMVEANNQAFQDLEEANASFKEYVTNYLQDLDIQAQIDDKLDRMFESGELTDYLRPYISSTVTTTVTTWLDENITEPTGVVIDSSLTVAGACADSKAVGERFKPIEYDIESLEELLSTKGVTDIIYVDGYSNENDTPIVRGYTPCVINTVNFNIDVRIKQIKLKSRNLGNLQIFKILKSKVHIGERGDRNDYIYLSTIDITRVGELTLNVSIPLEKEYFIAFGGQQTNDIYWSQGAFGNDIGYSYISSSSSTGLWVQSNNSLGITITADAINAEGEINYREVIKSVLKGKKISILGDSISTFSGYLPNGQATYYPNNNVPSVATVNDTWWKKIIDALDLVLSINNSWSGSMVTTNGGEQSAGCMSRTNNLGSPDIIIIYLGINDFNNGVVLGDYDGKTQIPTDTTIFASAYSIMLNKILTNYKTSLVYTCTLIEEERNLQTGFPEINSNGNSLTEFNDIIKKVSKIFNVNVLDIARCGLTYQNLETYNPNHLHPNSKGHSLIANYIIHELDNAVYKRYPTI